MIPENEKNQTPIGLSETINLLIRSVVDLNKRVKEIEANQKNETTQKNST